MSTPMQHLCLQNNLNGILTSVYAPSEHQYTCILTHLGAGHDFAEICALTRFSKKITLPVLDGALVDL